YLHPMSGDAGPDLCEHCGAPLGKPESKLFRMQNVSTRRRDKISSDEEERTRLGYDIITTVRFSEQNGQRSYRTGVIRMEDRELGHLTYGHTATIWRINLGWTRRKNKNQHGF